MGLKGSGGDFLTAGHDGVLRHFSKDPAKTGSAVSIQLMQSLEQEVRYIVSIFVI